ncbi:MAG: M23 family metallopeptidase [Nevskiales bacterium]|nr:M23 family metallopeptidase [Nevskiales bacterium]
MDIIVVSHKRGRTWKIPLDLRHAYLLLPVVLLVALLVTAAFSLGRLDFSTAPDTSLPEGLVAGWAQEAEAQRSAIKEARAEIEQNATALARRVARLQAHVLRLDAAGQRLTEIAGLDQGEFNFEQDPPVGGPESALLSEGSLDGVLSSLDEFEQQLSDRERQLRVLEDLLLASRLQKEVRPSGWPISSGWISSLFGVRTDPFSGRLTRHMGIDFAGKSGSDVLAVAAGIVAEAGPHDGYGNLVEINHGNGYATRYGHNSEILVKPGDKVAKGQAIAKMGSTGRSTGPHVHFEVLYNGVLVNPEQYIRAAR